MVGVAQSEAPAKEFGKYRVLLKLGEGGAANVYLAAARGPGGFNKLVVMKALKADFVGEEDVRDMFLREARLAARLNHPNIVQTNEVIEVGSVPNIVMEYLDGQALSDILRRAKGKLPLSMHLRIICDAIRGLHYAHELVDYDGTPLGLVHRDVTPHNVFVTFEGQVKLLDFGIAKVSVASPRTETGILKGKVRYMAPEQITGEGIDRRSDIFAVGVMLWEAIAGERIWRNENDAVIMNHVLKGKIPAPSTINPKAAPELVRICMRALELDQANRYPTAMDLETDLDAFLENFDSTASNRNVGKFVASLFEDVRASTKEVVARQLGKVSWDEYRPNESFTPPTLNQVRGATRTGPTLSTVAQSSTAPWTKGLIVVACLVTVAAMAKVLLNSASAVPSAATVGTTAALTPTAASGTGAIPVPSPSMVAVHIEATPPDARIYWDDRPLSSNPVTESFPADGVRHTIRADAAGYVSNSTVVVLDRDRDVRLALDRIKRSTSTLLPRHASTGPASTPSGASSMTASAPTSAPTNANCAVPYTVDDRGIKKIKRECL